MAGIIFLSWLTAIAIIRFTKNNRGTPWNGIGAILNNRKGESFAPMQYRMLQTWLFDFFDKFFRMDTAYNLLIFLSVLFCFGSVYIASGLFALCLLIWFILVSIKYDYVDYFYEIGFFALAFHGITVGNWFLVLVSIFLGSFNKESSILMAGIFFLSFEVISFKEIITTLILIIAWAIPQLYMRHKYGERMHYCGKTTKLTMTDLKWALKKPFSSTWVSFALMFVGLFSAGTIAEMFFVLSLIAAGLILGRLNEPRIFLPLLVVV